MFYLLDFHLSASFLSLEGVETQEIGNENKRFFVHDFHEKMSNRISYKKSKEYEATQSKSVNNLYILCKENYN